MTRRELLARTGCGFGLAAVAGIMQGAEANPLLPKPAPLPAKAKSVIYLHMHGGFLPNFDSASTCGNRFFGHQKRFPFSTYGESYLHRKVWRDGNLNVFLGK